MPPTPSSLSALTIPDYTFIVLNLAAFDRSKRNSRRQFQAVYFLGGRFHSLGYASTHRRAVGFQSLIPQELSL
jgi:hypothetical protein